MELKPELHTKIIAWLKKNPLEYYGDYQDKLSLDSVKQLMEDENKLEEEIWENSIDWISDQELELMNQMKDEFPELAEYDTADLREEFMDYIVNNINFLESCIRNTSPVRIRVVVNANEESMAVTNLFEETDGELTRILKIANGKTNDNYYNRVVKLLKGKFDIASMKQEIENCTTDYNQLIFYFSADIEDLVDINNHEARPWKKIKIPKEAWCGFFDSCNGAGSLLEVKLTQDIWIKQHYTKEHKYDYVEIVLDEAHRYGVEEVYGLCNVPKIKLEVK